MCGRITLRRSSVDPAVYRAHRLGGPETFSEHGQQPLRFNVCPSQPVAVVRNDRDDERVLTAAQWGLIPSWAKEDPKVKPINARSETVATSGMFRQAFDRRRCLVLADGYYEWKGSKPPKVPYFIHMADDRVFALAGLWERWKPSPDADPVETCTILTTTPNGVMEPLHNRMPVILAVGDYDRWLDPKATGKDVADLLRPYPADEMEAYPVSTRVNRPGNEGPKLIERA